ncbi:Uncharacterized protein FWK35_00013946 [Aphis craccivora]|uniref:Uncharacterized protein n=1 Tax=Aphis craccivora TaxID=307492 RepID=A0A6G0YJA5_APHCR|nr:Uncharacterized protein FWK35_00013946 [Aphis craccivora]
MLQFQTMGVVSDVKCIIGGKKLTFSNSFQKNQKIQKKKMTEKREFLRKTTFRLNRFFFMVVIQKLITENT